MLFSHRNVVIALAVLVTLFLFFRPSKLKEISPLQYLRALGKESPEILNSTLGFQQIFVISLPERSDRRDAMTLAAVLSKIDVTWIDGVAGKDVLDKVVPGDAYDKSISKGNKGSWRAHMNVLQRVVKSNMTSALILEDDADWDIRVKSQLQVFAQAARPFTQPTPKKPHKPIADLLTYDTQMPPELSFAQIPSDLVPKLTPYGDDWDVLWLGHCGTELPKNSVLPPATPEGTGSTTPSDPSQRPPQLRISIPGDPTVPEARHLKAHPFALNDALGELYPPHTRIVHASSATTCTQAYAVSQRGARKLLWQFGLQTLTAGWDLMLRDWCDGLYAAPAEGKGRKRPICVTVSPPLFSHHFGKGAASDITAPGGGFVNKEKEMTPYVRLSVRLNMGRLVAGAGLEDLVDQFPDEKRV